MKKQQFLSFFLSGLIALSCLAQPALAAAPTETESAEAETTQSAQLPDDAAEETDSGAAVESSVAESFSGLAATNLTPRSSILVGPEGLPQIDQLDCTAALLVDVTNRAVLYEQNAEQVVYPTDTVKIMTALVTLEAIEAGQLTLDTTVTITASMLSEVVSPDLLEGEQVTVEQLLYLLLLTAKDEAGFALAETVSSSTEAFVALMNDTAAELGCTNTHFDSPVGNNSIDQYTTCYDLFMITASAMAERTFANIVGAGSYTLPETNLHDSRFYYNANYLVSDRQSEDYNYTYATGVKVGSNYTAGTCIVSSADYDGRSLVSIVMGVTDRIDEVGNVIRPGYTMSADLFRYGFLQFYSVQLAERGEFVTQLDVTMGSDSDYVLLTTANDVTIDLVANITADDFSRQLVLPDSVQAPISAGDVVGQLQFTYDGTVYASVDLVAMTDVELSLTAQAKAMISAFFHHPVVRAILFLLVLCIVVLAVLVIRNLIARRRYRRQRKSRERRRTNQKKP